MAEDSSGTNSWIQRLQKCPFGGIRVLKKFTVEFFITISEVTSISLAMVHIYSRTVMNHLALALAGLIRKILNPPLKRQPKVRPLMLCFE